MYGVHLNHLWMCPLEAIACCVLLWRELGVASLAGVVAVALLVPLQGFFSKLFTRYRLRTAAVADERVMMTGQLVHGARLMKMNAWEHQLVGAIEELRAAEATHIFAANRLRAINMGVFFCAPTVICFLCFALAHHVAGRTLSHSAVFTSLALFNIIQFTIPLVFQFAVRDTSEAIVAANRIQSFLRAEEVPPPAAAAPAAGSSSSSAVDVSGLWCTWSGDDASHCCLEDVSFSVARGELLAVVGPVGCSKSSLLLALAGELGAARGRIAVSGTVHAALQQPFILSGTLRENILFLSDFDSERYEACLDACALRDDLEILPDGDQTVIGERGVNLSGGQKARLGLARVCYSAYQSRDAVVLLDDPLSAVDPKVARHLFRHCINGLLRHATRVLVTHQLHFAAEAGSLLELEKGKVKKFGPVEQLVGAAEAEAAKAKAEAAEMEVAAEAKAEAAAAKAVSVECEPAATHTGLVTAEGRESGDVSLATYAAWLRAAGGRPIVGLVVALLVAAQGASVGCGLWIWHWAAKPAAEQSSLPLLAYYGATLAACVIFSFARAAAFFHYCTVASCSLHNSMLRAVARAPMLFFDSQPVGRILNRLSKDVFALDETLPWIFYDTISIFVMVIASVVVACTIAPWTLVILAPLWVVFTGIRRYYLHSGRAVKRLEAITRSPVFSMLSEALDGLAAIHITGKTADFVARFDRAVDINSESFYVYLATHRWMSVRLDIVAGSLMATVCFLSLWAKSGGTADAGLIGLSLSFIIQIGPMFAWMMRQSGEVENQMVSMERVQGYIETAPEAALELASDAPAAGGAGAWPRSGRLELRSAVATYRDGLPPVLRGVSFVVPHASRVGIVGRTGAGKSSLIAALFRLIELTSGQVLLDGQDVAKVGLHLLRKSLSVIPQTPTLFSGTVRSNLDPFNRFTDAQIWAVLGASEMRATVEGLEGRLAAPVGESGCNLSVGERQLLCLARAMLPRNKVLVLDECTANVDMATDALIQTAVRKHFLHSTILMIAHRLDTIIDADLLLVLGGGELQERGTPHELLTEQPTASPAEDIYGDQPMLVTGQFASMVAHTGEESDARLRQIAAGIASAQRPGAERAGSGCGAES